jgi:nicotinate-nucleotide adenylyltransferase
MIIGVFGSAFDPPTLGHLDAIEQARQRCDRLLVLPSYSHPLKSTLLAYDLRINMLKMLLLATSDNVLLCEIEKEIFQGERVYTYDTLVALQDHYKEDTLLFFCGSDHKGNVHTFYRGAELLESFSVCYLKERLPIRSSLLKSDLTNIIKYTRPDIADYIESHNLYLS